MDSDWIPRHEAGAPTSPDSTDDRHSRRLHVLATRSVQLRCLSARPEIEHANHLHREGVLV